MLDLAVYDAHLTPQQVALEYAQLDSRSATLSAQHSEAPSAISHYPFTEGFGNVVHNTALSGADLSIPDRFRTLYRGFLIPPWEESADKLGIRDLAINILGFVPFGLLAFAYFRLHHDNARALALTVLAGFVITCTIEVLQAFIPGRLSGILDIITNTFGTYLGALLFRWQPIRNLAAKFDFYPAVNQPPAKITQATASLAVPLQPLLQCRHLYGRLETNHRAQSPRTHFQRPGWPAFGAL